MELLIPGATNISLFLISPKMRQKESFYKVFVRSFLIVTSVFSLFDFLENPRAMAIKDLYSSHKYILFTKISLFLTLMSALSGIIHRLTGNYSFMRDFLLPISFTFEFIVTSVYWTLFVIDKRLIINSESLKSGLETPMISMLASHIFPMVLSCIEHLDFTSRVNSYHMIFFAIFAILYYMVVTAYASYFGKYIYPFLDKLNGWQKMLFFVGIFIVGSGVYLLQSKVFGENREKYPRKYL